MTHNATLEKLTENKIAQVAGDIAAMVKLQGLTFEAAALIVFQKTILRGPNWEAAKQKCLEELK